MVLYGGDLRLMECLRLRVKDIDFANNERVLCACANRIYEDLTGAEKAPNS